MEKFNVRVEYGARPILHIAVQCPICKKWFNGRDITDDNISYYDDIFEADFECPLCEKSFGNINSEYSEYIEKTEPAIIETSYPYIYDGCLKKRIVWE